MDFLVLGFRFTLIFVFVAAALPKLRDRESFQKIVTGYDLLPERFVGLVAAVLPTLELGLAAALALGIAPQVSSVAIASLLVAFAAAAFVNLLRGRTVDCGCFGNAAGAKISWGGVGRDLLMAVMAIAVAIRPPFVWSVSSPSATDMRSSVSSRDAVAVLISSTLIVVIVPLLQKTFRLRTIALSEPSVREPP